MNAGYIYDNNQYLIEEGIDLSKISQVTRELIDRVNKVNYCHGFEGVDLSRFDLTNLTLDDIGNITFDENTKWPNQDKLPKGFNPHLLLKNRKGAIAGLTELRNEGITGKGVNVVYIDQQNKYVFNHEEFKHLNYEYFDFNGDDLDCFHPYGVLSNLCGKNTGVAPNINLFYYSAYRWKQNDKSMLECLTDVLNKLKKGKAFDIVGISGPLYLKKDVKTKEQKQIDLIVEQIEFFGCVVVDGFRFLDSFTCCGLEALDQYSFNNIDYPTFATEEDKLKPAFICKGQVIAEWQTSNKYVYQGTNCDSWPTAQCVGLFALCRQVDEKITWNKFIANIRKSLINNKVIDFRQCIEQTKNNMRENSLF